MLYRFLCWKVSTPQADRRKIYIRWPAFAARPLQQIGCFQCGKGLARISPSSKFPLTGPKDTYCSLAFALDSTNRIRRIKAYGLLPRFTTRDTNNIRTTRQMTSGEVTHLISKLIIFLTKSFFRPFFKIQIIKFFSRHAEIFV